MDNTLKAGDLVRILPEGSECGEYTVGGIYPILKIDEDGDPWIVGDDGEEWPFFTYINEFERVEDDRGEAWTTP